MFEKFLTGLAWVGHWMFLFSLAVVGILSCVVGLTWFVVSLHIIFSGDFWSATIRHQSLACAGMILGMLLLGLAGHIYLHEKGELS